MLTTRGSDPGSKRPAFVYLYLNGRSYKLVVCDLSILGTVQRVCVVPKKIHKDVTPYFKKHHYQPKRFFRSVTFHRRTIPVGPGLNEIRYYGTDEFLDVDSEGVVEFHLPYDPEDSFYTEGGFKKLE